MCIRVGSVAPCSCDSCCHLRSQWMRKVLAVVATTRFAVVHKVGTQERCTSASKLLASSVAMVCPCMTLLFCRVHSPCCMHDT